MTRFSKFALTTFYVLASAYLAVYVVAWWSAVMVAA